LSYENNLTSGANVYSFEDNLPGKPLRYRVLLLKLSIEKARPSNKKKRALFLFDISIVLQSALEYALSCNFYTSELISSRQS
jgi:hypothetical protein